MADEIVEIIEGLNQPIKIRDYLKNKLGFSTSLIAKVKYDNVLLNGKTVHMRAMVENGDEIRVLFPEEESENILPIEIPIDVIYEDDDVIAINKPTNMPVHPCRGNSLPTLANALRHYLGKPFVFRSVNRLDRDTSGIVLVAKNQLACIHLSRQMQANSMTKIYYAIVEGEMPAHGEISAPIARESPDSLRRIVREGGKDSLTEYELIERTEDGNSLLRITLHTGRTHQIRVHMAHIGHPLVNDFMYGTQKGNEIYRLHCGELSFIHPRTGKTITLKCDIPNN